LISVDDSLPYILFGFELLDHTDKKIATRQNYNTFFEAETKIKGGDLAETGGLASIVCSWSALRSQM